MMLVRKRFTAEIAARDALAAGDTLNVCCFVCVFVNGRNTALIGELCSLFDGTLFYIPARTAGQRFSLDSLALSFQITRRAKTT